MVRFKSYEQLKYLDRQKNDTRQSLVTICQPVAVHFLKWIIIQN